MPDNEVIVRILVVSQYFWPEDFRINDICRGLIDRGHNVTVLTGKPNYPGGSILPGYRRLSTERDMYHGAEVIRVPMIPRFSGRGWQLALNYASYALSATMALPRLRNNPYDCIFVFEVSPVTVGIPAVMFRRWQGVPLAFWVLDLWPESLVSAGRVKAGWLLRATGKLVTWIYRNCDRILMASSAFGPNILAQGARREQLAYFPNHAEPEYGKDVRDETVPEFEGIPEGFRVTFAGNIGAAQAFDAIIGAADHLRGHEDIHWIIVGDGRKAAWVRRQVKEKRLEASVHLVGRHPPDRMPAVFNASSALLVSLRQDPSLAVTVPGKVISYLAAGRPIVAALDGEGARLIQEAGAGVICPAGNARELAAAVMDMYRLSTDEREAMGTAGAAYSKANFDREALLDRLESIFEDMAACAHTTPISISG